MIHRKRLTGIFKNNMNPQTVHSVTLTTFFSCGGHEVKPSEASLLSDHINTELRRWPLFTLSIHDFKKLYDKENTIKLMQPVCWSFSGVSFWFRFGLWEFFACLFIGGGVFSDYFATCFCKVLNGWLKAGN